MVHSERRRSITLSPAAADPPEHHPMTAYLIRRLLLTVPTLLGMTALVFFVLALQPGGIGAAAMADKAGARAADVVKMREYYEKRFGLNKPVVVQYLRWLNLVSPIGFEVDEDGNLARFGF